MAERKHLKKSERMEIYNKTGGHCAYCGCELRYEDIHDLDESGWSNKRVEAMQHLKAAKEILEHEGE